MSFLNELRTKRDRLKPTTTTLTTLDGRVFKESGPESPVEIARTPYGFVVDERPDNAPAKIVQYVYLGSQDCCDSEVLAEFDIDSVLSVGVDAPFKRDKVSYKFVPCLDIPETDLLRVLKESVCFIQDAVQRQSNVLVHCNAGVSRSASVVIGYLILVCGYNYFNAYQIVKKARSCVRPNNGFVEQLKKLSSK